MSLCMHIHTQQNKMFFCEVLATHQSQDDKFETNISILAGDCHIVATSNSCRVSVLYKHPTLALLSHFKAGLPYEDFRKQMLIMARALPPAAEGTPRGLWANGTVAAAVEGTHGGWRCSTPQPPSGTSANWHSWGVSRAARLPHLEPG